MARRRRYNPFSGAGRTPKPPKPPKMPKMARPKVKDLRAIMKGLLTTDIGQRLNSMAYILKWYDEAIAYLTLKQKGALSEPQRKSLERVFKSRTQGMGTNYNHEKEQAYRTAVRILETLCMQELQPPRIDSYYKRLDAMKPKLEKKTERLEEKFGPTMEMLQKALQPRNQAGELISIQVGPVASDAQKDPELKQITYSPAKAKEIHRKRIREGLLAAVMLPDVIEELAKLSSMEKQTDQTGAWTGQWVIKAVSLATSTHQMLRNLIGFAQGPEAPKRLVKAAQPDVPRVVDPNAPPKVKRAGGFGLKRGPMLEGAFVIGTDIAKLFEKLNDGQVHNKKELQAMISTKLEGRLSVINKKGLNRGWKVIVKGSEVRLDRQSAPAAAPQP